MHGPTRGRPGTPASPATQKPHTNQRYSSNLQQVSSPYCNSDEPTRDDNPFQTPQGSTSTDISSSRRRAFRRRQFLVTLIVASIAATCTTAVVFLPPGSTHRSITLMALNWLRVPGWLQQGATGSHESGACAKMTEAQCACCRSTNTTCVNARCAQLLLPTPASRNLSCRVIFNNAPQRQQEKQQGSESASGYGHPEADYLHIPVLGVPVVSQFGL